MRDAFHAITLAVRKIVHGINAPFIAGAVVVRMLDAVNDGIAHEHVGMLHVNFSAKGAAAIGELTVLHAAKQVKVFFRRAAAEWAVLAGFSWRAFHGGYFF